jgi:hypothetical protein
MINNICRNAVDPTGRCRRSPKLISAQQAAGTGIRHSRGDDPSYLIKACWISSPGDRSLARAELLPEPV